MSDSGHPTELCVRCNRPLGPTTFVIEGLLGTYIECEWCYAGTDRPPEPEMITDTFTSWRESGEGLDAILDKLTGERA